MDFSNSDIPKILQGSIPNRFNDFSPQDFEDFIAKVFKDKGYTVQQTPYTADYGVDLITELDGIKYAIQIKRYAKENKVSVSEINQINGAKSYYDCSEAMLVTTSGLSTNAEETANKLGVLVWDWVGLIKEFKNLYWEGRDFYSFYDIQYDALTELDTIKFDVHNVAFDLQTGSYGTFTGIVLKATNVSNENIRFSIRDHPQFVDLNMDQISSMEDDELRKEFVIYSGCSKKLNVFFPTKDVPSVKVQERLIVEIFDHGKDNTETHHILFNKDYNPITYKEVSHNTGWKNDPHTMANNGDGFWSTAGEAMVGLGKALLIILGAILAAFIWLMSVLLGGKK